MSSQDSGAKRRPRSVDGFANWFANSNTTPRQGRLPPQIWDPDGAASLPFIFDWRCRADCAFGLPSFQMVGMARRRRPKIQVRSGVCEEHANSNALPNKGGFAAKVGADGASPSKFRWALPRRLRVRRALRSKW